ncbi:LOW QUALITY PROTEIN: protein NDRG2-like [Amazona ochrocephala]
MMEPNEAAPPPAEGKQGALLETLYGPVAVSMVGTSRPGRPTVVTFPDVGHTSSSCFGALFAHEEMQELLRSFAVLHVEPPGMEGGAPPYPPGYQYPSLDQLASMLPGILQPLHINSIIGIGVGVGAFVLAKFGLLHPEAVEGLVLINIDPKAKGWMDWAAHKLSGLTTSTNEQILGHSSPRWVPMGHLWGTYGSLWGTYGSLWGTYGALMGPYGALMGLYGSLWGTYGSLWGTYGALMGLYGLLMGLCLGGHLWVPMGHLWVSLCPYGALTGPYGSILGTYGSGGVTYGSLWVPVALYGALMGLYGSLWVSMGQAELAAAPPYVQHLRQRLNSGTNSAHLWTMYSSRGDLGLQRSGAGSLRCPVLLVVGDVPHVDAVVECNAKLDPTQTSFLKMADGGGQPQITQPAKLTEAFKYFVQGMGYMAASAMTRLSRSRSSVSSSTSGEGERGRSRTLSRAASGGAHGAPPH